MSSKAALRIAKFIGVTFRNQNVLTLGGCWHYKKHLRGQANTNGKQFEAQSESQGVWRFAATYTRKFGSKSSQISSFSGKMNHGMLQISMKM